MSTDDDRRGIFARLYNGETSFDFVGRARVWAMLSGGIILIGLISLFLQGLNFGIDFTGGTAWEVPGAKGVSVPDARDALRPVGLADAKVQIVGGDTLRVQGDVSGSTAEKANKRDDVSKRLAELAKVPTSRVSVNQVGPSWGNEITKKAQRALVFFLIAITLYITLRFEWKMAVATLAALFHDVLVTVGVYSLSGFEVTPATVIAGLTILGYSIYDGIVVFDKIDENTKGLASSGRMTYGDMVNLSLNQVLMRTLNTSITALLPILSLLVVGGFILGATTLEDFALALLIGLGASAYSSIFIASPLLAVLKEREARYASIKQRVRARGLVTPLTPAAAAASGNLGAGGGSSAGGGAGAAVGGDGTSTRAGRPVTTRPAASRQPPRPRKKGKRR
ncbi:MAG TPA: protein translocase subunit SecF [Acidimicrobiales bacterium]|nr:protein translocase subunit SecF [Acidimicrobiales bacterium]